MHCKGRRLANDDTLTLKMAKEYLRELQPHENEQSKNKFVG